MGNTLRAITPPQKTQTKPQIIIGIGNCGRSDDGLGWAFLDAIEESGVFQGPLVYRYQLQVEDAELISRFDSVLFVDATYASLAEGHQLVQVIPEIERSFSTHALEPSTILGLCDEVYGRRPETQLLMIEGERWELHNGLSEIAASNLKAALRMFLSDET